MKKTALLFALLISTLAKAQTSDYRTTEDGINQLINNADFLDKMSHMSNEQIANTSLDMLLNEFVPEYKDFKADKGNINLNNIYYGNSGNIASQKLSGSLGQLLGLDNKETNELQSLLSGENSFGSYLDKASGTNVSSQINQAISDPIGYLGNSLDNALGTGSAMSDLLGLGAGWLAGMEEDMAKSEQAEKARAAAIAAADKAAKEYKAGQDAFVLPATKEMTAACINVWDRKYDEAIKGYTKAIALFKQADGKNFEVMRSHEGRARAKLGKGDNRGAIVDYYLALCIYNKLASQTPEETPLNSLVGNSSSIRISSGGKNTDQGVEPLDKYRLLRNRAYAKYMAGDYAAAVNDCELALGELQKQYPGQYDWRNGAIKKQTVEGLQHMNQELLFLFSEEVTVMYDLVAIAGMSKASLGQYAEADNYLNHITAFKADNNYGTDFTHLPAFFNFQIFQVKGYSFMQQKEYAKALDLYSYLTRIASMVVYCSGGDASKIYLGRAGVYVAQKDYKNALADIEKAIEYKPTEGAYYSARADCKMLLGDKDGAAKDNELAKNPVAAAANTKKTITYYANKVTELQNRKDNAGLLKLYEEGLLDMPDEMYFVTRISDGSKTFITKEKVLELSNKVKGNGLAANALKALYCRLGGDTKQCMELGIKGIQANLPVSTFIAIYPDYEKDKDYCKYAKMLRDKELSEQAPSLKEAYKKQVDGRLSEAATTPAHNFGLALAYYNTGEPAKAITAIDAELATDGKLPNSARFLELEVKIKSMLQLEKNKEAVVVAKNFIKPRKKDPLYEVYSEGTMYDFIKNIAADYCGYDTK